MDIQVPTDDLCLYKPKSTLQIFDEVDEIVKEMKEKAETSKTKVNLDKPDEIASSGNILLFPELPAYLGQCFSVCCAQPSSQMTMTKSEHKKPNRRERAEHLLRTCAWKIPMKDVILFGRVSRETKNGLVYWNFYWSQGSKDSMTKIDREKSILKATRSKSSGSSCFTIFTNYAPGKQKIKILGKLEGNSKLSKFSLYNDGLDEEKLIELHNQEKFGEFERKVECEDEMFEDCASPFTLQLRAELGIILVNRGHSNKFWKPAQPRTLTLLLPHFKRQDYSEESCTPISGLETFSHLDWNRLPFVSVCEKFSGSLVKDLKDNRTTKDLSLSALNASTEDDFVFNMTKSALDNEFDVQFRSPLSLCHAFALALTAIETNFK